MLRWLAIAVCGTAMTAAPVWGQMRGGFGRGMGQGFAPRAPVTMHGAGAQILRSGPIRSIGSPAVRLNGVPRFSPGHFHGRGGHIFVGRPFFRNHHHRFFSPVIPFGFYGGYYAAPWYYDQAMESYADYGYANDPYYQQAQQLQQQVDQLSDEVDQLREQQEQRRAETAPTIREVPTPAQSSEEAKPTPPISTTLIFRDGRRESIGNYAIVDHVLWVLDEQHAKKIPLTQLDLPATQKANEDQGVNFSPPARAVCKTPQECTIQWR